MVVSIDLGKSASRIGASPRASRFTGNGGGIFEDDVSILLLGLASLYRWIAGSLYHISSASMVLLFAVLLEY